MSAPVERMKNETEQAIASAFDAHRSDLPGNADIANVREAAFARFDGRGLPSRRVEAWHYTDLRAQMRSALPLAGRPDATAAKSLADSLPAIEGACARIVLVDGFFMEALSDAVPAGVSMAPLERALEKGDAGFIEDIAASGLGEDDAALALNTAFMSGGVVIDVAAGFEIGSPFHVVCVASRGAGAAIHARSLLRVGDGAKLTIVEHHAGAGNEALQLNDALVVLAGRKAQVEHIFLREGTDAGVQHVNSMLAKLDEEASLKSFALSGGGGLLRRQVFLRFAGENASCDFSGVGLLGGKLHADTTMVVEHAVPHCASREYFKQIVDDEATGVFQGKVVVAPHAQKTDGAMKSQTILLSDDAAMYNKPELEIFADDVVCAHGATVGSLDPNQLFYCMSRGIPRPEAEALVLEAFAADAVAGVTDEALRETIMTRVRGWLARRNSLQGQA